MAEAFDALRFGGPIGRLIAETQEQVHRRVPRAASPGRTVLDVGTGTGRAAIALARRGARRHRRRRVARDARGRARAARRRPASGVDVRCRRRARARRSPIASFDASSACAC